MQKAISASRIFTGTGWLDDYVIVVEDGLISELVPRKIYTGKNLLHFKDSLVVPPFVDLQVYGAAGKLLAVDPSAATLELMYQTFISQGTTHFLPTVATNTMEVFRACIDAVRTYWNAGGKGVEGLHLEGPWLHQEKRGAHVKEWIHPPDKHAVLELLAYGKGVIKMITIAPEVCSDEIIALLLSEGILLSAGHSNARYEEALDGFDKGIAAVTHLFNAMSPLQHRSPGLVGATFMHTAARASIIPDGIHVDYAAVTIAKKIMGERLFAITDAVTETITGPYRHQLNVDRYECNGVLSGSALTMHQAFLNLVHHAGIEAEEALRMCSLYPAQLAGIRGGRFVPQNAGQFLVLDQQYGFEELVTL